LTFDRILLIGLDSVRLIFFHLFCCDLLSNLVFKYCTGLGAVEHKLFVGSLNKQASEKEIEEVRS
jgi:hypothetical protein